MTLLSNCRSQFLLDRLGRCLKLFVSTVSPSCHEFVWLYSTKISIMIMSYGSETWIYLKSVQNMINIFETRSAHRTKCALFRWHPALLKTRAEHCGAIVECLASHGRNMSPMRCLTGPTQSPPSLMDFLRGDWLSMVT